MFAYCLNNPVNFTDDNGKSPDWTPWGEFFEELGNWLSEQTQEDNRLIESGEVSYSKNKNNDGAHIHNSHKIKMPWSMIKFVIKNRGEEIEGSTAGFVFEWYVHNVAYDITGSERAAHVDVGTTIWADRHGLASVGMILSYLVISPISAIYDYIMEYDDYDLLYPRE